MTAKELSVFCSEVALLLEAAIMLDEGFYTMAEDAPDRHTKELLTGIAQKLEQGEELPAALEASGEFPPYVVKMARVGQETGNLDVIMNSLAEYYANEHTLARTIKNAFTYPIVMVFILLLIFFVLFTKVMPIFEDIYEQVGTRLSASAQTAINVGGILSGVLLAVIAIFAIVAVIVVLMSRNGHSLTLSEKIASLFKEKSSIATAISKRRFAAVMSLCVKSGLNLDEGLEMARELVTQKKSVDKIDECIEKYQAGTEFHTALSESGLFEGMDLQMLQVGNRAGRLDTVMEQIAEKYEQLTDETISGMINRFEPTMVAVLAIIVGMILFSVMMPLIGIMSSIG